MNLFFLIRSLGYGGAERQLVALAKGLHEKGHRVTVAVFYPGGPLQADLEPNGVNVINLNKCGRWDVFPFLPRLIALIRREKPELLYSFLSGSNIVSILIKVFWPRGLLVWGILASNMDWSRYDWFARMVSRLEKLLSGLAHLIIVNSQAGRDYSAAQGFPADKMVVILTGIDTERFRPDSAAGGALRKAWGIEGNESLVGIVGRFDPMKDHPTFLKAAVLMARQCQKVRFVCVGEGPDGYVQELRDMASRLGLMDLIHWSGPSNDMPAVHNAIDLLTSTSAFGEGFPNVIGEAMACGTPCVVTDVGDSARIVGDAGIVVRPVDPEAICGAWMNLLGMADSQLGALGKKARLRVQRKFSVTRMVTETESYLLKLL